jgi:hypothetical protein
MDSKTISVYVDNRTLELLDRMAKADRRSRSNQFALLVAEAAERRGLVKKSDQDKNGQKHESAA